MRNLENLKKVSEILGPDCEYPASQPPTKKTVLTFLQETCEKSEKHEKAHFNLYFNPNPLN